MRRVTLHKPPTTRNARRLREEAEELPAERPEVRKDIARTWWPEAERP
ncbi:hypothetical protein [Streptomyces sp. B93]|nr:hypothetical protein [Streptomyces sp. B93]MBQ1092033.1 hypothetical protein [Streptomyces sp. B93]